MRYEKPIFPMKNMNITQGYNGSYSHKGTMAIDMAGKDSGKEPAVAPCTIVIKRQYTSGTYWESLYQVYLPNGEICHINGYMFHDENTSNLKVGQVIPQGTPFYDEGRYGNATGNHIHMIVGKGKCAGGFYNTYKNWCLKNQVAPETVLWILNGTNVLNDGGYKWKYTDTTYHEPQNDFRKYVVQKGDTLTKIAKKFGVNYKDIAVLNKMANPNKISIGQVLVIPNK